MEVFKRREVEPIFTPVLSHDKKSIFYVEENNHRIRKLDSETKEDLAVPYSNSRRL